MQDSFKNVKGREFYNIKYKAVTIIRDRSCLYLLAINFIHPLTFCRRFTDKTSLSCITESLITNRVKKGDVFVVEDGIGCGKPSCYSIKHMNNCKGLENINLSNV